jgi:hypothetical protein
MWFAPQAVARMRWRTCKPAPPRTSTAAGRSSLSSTLPLANVDGKDLAVPVTGLAPIGINRNVSVAVLAGEGDRTGPGLTAGEHLLLNGTPLATDRHPDGNVFRSSAVGLADDPITFGTDVEVFSGSAPGGADVLALQADTDNDGVTISAVALLYDL